MQYHARLYIPLPFQLALPAGPLVIGRGEDAAEFTVSHDMWRLIRGNRLDHGSDVLVMCPCERSEIPAVEKWLSSLPPRRYPIYKESLWTVVSLSATFSTRARSDMEIYKRARNALPHRGEHSILIDKFNDVVNFLRTQEDFPGSRYLRPIGPGACLLTHLVVQRSRGQYVLCITTHSGIEVEDQAIVRAPVPVPPRKLAGPELVGRLLHALEDDIPVNTSELLLANARNALAERRFRMSVIEAVSAMDVALAPWLNSTLRNIGTSKDDAGSIQRELGLAYSLEVGLRGLSKGPSPARLIKRCRQATSRRNKAVHEGNPVSARDAENAVHAAADLLGYLDIFPAAHRSAQPV